MNDQKFLQKALQVAKKAAQSSGKVLMKKYKKITLIEQKEADIQDLVTEADFASEKIIKETISSVFPKHSVLAEESGLKDSKSEYLWVVDPLCGTANFINQIELFVVSIALVKQNQLVLAVVYDPDRKNLYSAVDQQGAFFNGVKADVSGVKTIGKATIAFNLGKTKLKRQKWLPIIGKMITSCYKIREYGSGPLSGALLATGRIDGYVHPGPHLWDASTIVLLTREAGGKVTDWQGEEWHFGSESLLATNGKIHHQLLKILNQ